MNADRQHYAFLLDAFFSCLASLAFRRMTACYLWYDGMEFIDNNAEIYAMYLRYLGPWDLNCGLKAKVNYIGYVWSLCYLLFAAFT